MLGAAHIALAEQAADRLGSKPDGLDLLIAQAADVAGVFEYLKIFLCRFGI